MPKPAVEVCGCTVYPLAGLKGLFAALWVVVAALEVELGVR